MEIEPRWQRWKKPETFLNQGIGFALFSTFVLLFQPRRRCSRGLMEPGWGGPAVSEPACGTWKKGNESMNRYSAKNTLVPVNFRYVDPKAKQVKLIGDFNGWDQEAHVMERTPDGAWFLQLSIHSGHHRYLYLVDGEPMLDPQANGVTQSDEGIRVSLMMVS